MPVQIYIAPQQGNGSIDSLDRSTWTPTTGPWRSILHDLIDVQAGDSFTEIDHPARMVSICCVTASTATLDGIEADVRAKAVLPVRATDDSHFRQILNTGFSSYPLAWRTAARDFLETHGVDMGWVTGSHTLKDVLSFIVRMFSCVQVANGDNLPDVKEFIKEHLDTTVGSIAPAKRDAIAAWLTSKGIDVSWVTGTTTVREIVTLLPKNYGKLYGVDVPIRWIGEDL